MTTIVKFVRYKDEFWPDAGEYVPLAEYLEATQELRALRELREVCGSYCERLPVEVREALHAIPGIEKTHPAHVTQNNG